MKTTLDQHPLYEEAWENVVTSVWPVLQKQSEAMRSELNKELVARGPQALEDVGQRCKLSRGQAYEHSSWYWCNRMIVVFHRLETIQNMMGHSLYLKKNERRSQLLEDWVRYNWEHYAVAYQSVLEVALLLCNEMLVLGYPSRECRYDVVCNNTRVKNTPVYRALQKLQKTTSEHRKGKNLLVHEGQRILPSKAAKDLDTVELFNLAARVGADFEDRSELLANFLSWVTKPELLEVMDDERNEIEEQVTQLLGELLPYYRLVRGLYQAGLTFP